jgi:hypothetical protein
MSRQSRSSAASLLAVAALAIGIISAQAQAPRPPQTAPEVVPDDMLTLVVGTRFVAASGDEASARTRFLQERLPLAGFNDTDRCIDEQSLEIAKEYFTTLGRLLSKAGHYYFVPEEEIRKSAAICERLHHRPPQAWVDNATKIIAFGQVVPTVDAPALEQSIR